MYKIVFENVTKKFGKVVALYNLNLRVKKGNFIVLLGPSGCGKTTTLRLLAGLEEASEGDIYIGNRLVNDLEPKERGIAMVFQDYALYPHMTVFDNMAFGLRNLGTPKEEIRNKIKWAAELLQISDLLYRKPAQLSGGQKQRVAVGRAIVREPEVFLMDEPLSNLDAKLRVTMRMELHKLQRKLGVTTLYVTHDQVEAMSLGDQIVLLSGGKVQQIGSPDDLYFRPRNKFVAGFIGAPAMNFLECDLVEKNDRFFLCTDFFTLPFDHKIKNLVTRVSDPKIVLGVRPEDIIIAHDKNKNAMEVKIEGIESLGSENIAYSTVGGNNLVFKLTPASRVKVGQKVKISFEKIHLFDKSTENAIY